MITEEKIVFEIILIKKSKKNKISLKQKIKLLLIHKFYSNYQPMTLDNWTEKNSKRNSFQTDVLV